MNIKRHIKILRDLIDSEFQRIRGIIPDPAIYQPKIEELRTDSIFSMIRKNSSDECTAYDDCIRKHKENLLKVCKSIGADSKVIYSISGPAYVAMPKFEEEYMKHKNGATTMLQFDNIQNSSLTIGKNSRIILTDSSLDETDIALGDNCILDLDLKAYIMFSKIHAKGDSIIHLRNCYPMLMSDNILVAKPPYTYFQQKAIDHYIFYRSLQAGQLSVEGDSYYLGSMNSRSTYSSTGFFIYSLKGDTDLYYKKSNGDKLKLTVYEGTVLSDIYIPCYNGDSRVHFKFAEDNVSASLKKLYSLYLRKLK